MFAQGSAFASTSSPSLVAATSRPVDLSSAFSGPPSYRSVVLAQQPLAYWRLGETSTKQRAADSTGNGRSGRYTSCVQLQAKGAIVGSANTAGLFPHSNCYMRYTPSSSYTGAYTAEAWIKPEGSTAREFRTFLDSRAPDGAQSGEFGFDLKLVGTQFSGIRAFSADIGDGSEWLYSGLVPFSYVTGRWYFVAATVGAKYLSIYVNGALLAKKQLAPGGPALLMDQSHPLVVGDNPRYEPPGSTDGSFAGAIDEVALFDHALSGQQVLAQYAAGLAKFVTATKVSLSSVTPSVGQSVSYSAHVTSPGGTPTGQVAFGIGSRVLCTAPLSAGSARCRSSAAPGGADKVTARYGGGGRFIASAGTAILTVYRSLDDQLRVWSNGDPIVRGPGSNPQQIPEAAVFSPGSNAPALFPGSVVQAAPENVATGTLISNPLPAGSGTVTMTGLLLQHDGRVSQKVSSATLPNVSQAIQNLASQPAYPNQTGYESLDYTLETSSQQAEFTANASFSYLGSGGSGFFSDADSTSETHIFFHLRQAYYQVSYTPSQGDLSGFFAKGLTTRQALGCQCMSTANPPAYISSVTYGSELYVMADGSATASDMTEALKAAVSYGAANGSGSVSAKQRATLDQMQVHVLALGGSAPAESDLFSDIPGDGGTKILSGITKYIQAQFSPKSDAVTAAVPIDYSLAYLDYHPIGMFPTPTAGQPPIPLGTTSSITVCVTVGNNDKEMQTPVYLSLTGSDGASLLPQTGDMSGGQYWNDGYSNCSNPWVLGLSETVPTYELSGATFTVNAPGDSWHGQFQVWADDNKYGKRAVVVTQSNMYYNDTGDQDPCGQYIGHSFSEYSFSLAEPGTNPSADCGTSG
jgi:hypothetical protein